MDVKIVWFILFINVHFGTSNFKGRKGEPGVCYMGSQGWPGRKGDSGLPGPPGRTGFPGEKGERGYMGQDGLPGSKGEIGYTGPKGETGLQGQKGEQGYTGPPGSPGINGERGDQGFMGLQGMPGIKGDIGNTGPMGPRGYKGEPGEIGPPGSPGLPGVCPTFCPVIEFKEPKTFPDDDKPNVGTEEIPSPAICKFIPVTRFGEDAPDPYWVMKEEKFPVRCDKLTNRTCLILEHNDHDWIEETKILIGSATKGIWLSKTGFNLEQFNTISHKQMHWLKEQSINVRQTIRVYTESTTFDNIILRLLNGNDIIVDQSPSAVTPMFYTVGQRNQVTVRGTTWQYVDLVIIDDADRLPVRDLYVEYIPKDMINVYISIQLRELCFG